MENSTKRLKTSSILVLIWAGISLFKVVGEIFFGELNEADIPADAPSNILLITKIILVVVSFIILFPQIYIGIKGLKIAKNPKPAKAHIFWAIVLLVFSALSLISPAVEIVKQVAVVENISIFFVTLVEFLVIFDYVRNAKEVANSL